MAVAFNGSIPAVRSITETNRLITTKTGDQEILNCTISKNSNIKHFSIFVVPDKSDKLTEFYYFGDFHVLINDVKVFDGILSNLNGGCFTANPDIFVQLGEIISIHCIPNTSLKHTWVTNIVY